MKNPVHQINENLSALLSIVPPMETNMDSREPNKCDSAILEELEEQFGIEQTQTELRNGLMTLKKVTDLKTVNLNEHHWNFLNRQYLKAAEYEPFLQIVVSIMNAFFTQRRSVIGINRKALRTILKMDLNWKNRVGFTDKNYRSVLKALHSHKAFKEMNPNKKNGDMSIFQINCSIATKLLGLTQEEIEKQALEIIAFVEKHRTSNEDFPANRIPNRISNTVDSSEYQVRSTKDSVSSIQDSFENNQTTTSSYLGSGEAATKNKKLDSNTEKEKQQHKTAHYVDKISLNESGSDEIYKVVSQKFQNSNVDDNVPDDSIPPLQQLIESWAGASKVFKESADLIAFDALKDPLSIQKYPEIFKVAYNCASRLGAKYIPIAILEQTFDSHCRRFFPKNVRNDYDYDNGFIRKKLVIAMQPFFDGLCKSENASVGRTVFEFEAALQLTRITEMMDYVENWEEIESQLLQLEKECFDSLQEKPKRVSSVHLITHLLRRYASSERASSRLTFFMLCHYKIELSLRRDFEERFRNDYNIPSHLTNRSELKNDPIYQKDLKDEYENLGCLYHDFKKERPELFDSMISEVPESETLKLIPAEYIEFLDGLECR